jgi:hypothetical protein
VTAATFRRRIARTGCSAERHPRTIGPAWPPAH